MNSNPEEIHKNQLEEKTIIKPKDESNGKNKTYFSFLKIKKR
jgi:hypothetical protein